MPEHPMLRHLPDLESWFEPEAPREYDAAELVRYALGGSDYWADLALGWMEQGVHGEGLLPALLLLEGQERRPQSLRDRARRVRQSL